MKLYAPLKVTLAMVLGCSSVSAISGDDAVKLAVTYSGIDKWIYHDSVSNMDTQAMRTIRVRSAASEVQITDDRTPFIHRHISASPVYRVVFDSVRLGPEDTLVRSVEVLIEPVSGRLLKIETRYPKPDSLLPPPPSASEAERQLTDCHESYVLPDSAPPLSLFEACQRASISGFHTAKEFSAVYVVWSNETQKDVSAWVITMRGLRPFPAFGGRPHDTPLSDSAQLRLVIDGTTGRLLWATNYPLSVTPDD